MGTGRRMGPTRGRTRCPATARRRSMRLDQWRHPRRQWCMGRRPCPSLVSPLLPIHCNCRGSIARRTLPTKCRSTCTACPRVPTSLCLRHYPHCRPIRRIFNRSFSTSRRIHRLSSSINNSSSSSSSNITTSFTSSHNGTHHQIVISCSNNSSSSMSSRNSSSFSMTSSNHDRGSCVIRSDGAKTRSTPSSTNGSSASSRRLRQPRRPPRRLPTTTFRRRRRSSRHPRRWGTGRATPRRRHRYSGLRPWLPAHRCTTSTQMRTQGPARPSLHRRGRSWLASSIAIRLMSWCQMMESS